MTIKQAQAKYRYEIEECYKQTKIETKKSNKKMLKVGSVLLFIGIVLLIVGLAIPPKTDYVFSDGSILTSRTIGAMLAIGFGALIMWIGTIAFILFIVSFISLKKDKIKIDATPYIIELYLNYIRCEDLSPEDKEYYKQKLENYRAGNIARSMDSASAMAAAAMMYSAINK